MPELLRAEIVGEARLGAPEPALDPATAAVVEQQAAAAYARGRAEGERAGRAAASEEAKRAADAVAGCVEALYDETLAQREAATAATLELARQLALEVLARTPPDDAFVVLERVREAAAALDDVPLEVRLHPADHATLQGVSADGRLQFVADAAIAAGEARLSGAWGGAEITRAGLLDAVIAACEEEGG